MLALLAASASTTLAVGIRRAATAPHATDRQRSLLPSRRSTLPGAFYSVRGGLSDDYPSTLLDVAARARGNFAVAVAAGAPVFRFGLSWLQVEQNAASDDVALRDWSAYDAVVAEAARCGVVLIPYVCYTPFMHARNASSLDYWREPPRDVAAFARFVSDAAARYRDSGVVASWELWNEPDNTDFWRGTAAEYAQLTAAGAEAVRRSDPRALVVLGGLANGRSAFFDEVWTVLTNATSAAATVSAAGDTRGVVDVVNVHGYFETWADDRAETYEHRLRDLYAIVHPVTDLWMAEFGYSAARTTARAVSDWASAVYVYEHTAAFQAGALFRHHVIVAATGRASLTTWYRVRDLAGDAVIGDDNNRHFGVLDVHGARKPAFYALRLFNTLFGAPVRNATLDIIIDAPSALSSFGAATTLEMNDTRFLVAHAFERVDGSVVVAAWLPTSATRGDDDGTGVMVDRRRACFGYRVRSVMMPALLAAQTFDVTTGDAQAVRSTVANADDSFATCVAGGETYVALHHRRIVSTVPATTAVAAPDNATPQLSNLTSLVGGTAAGAVALIVGIVACVVLRNRRRQVIAR